MTVRFGIIGCGRIAQGAIAPAIGWAHNARLHAIASRDEARAADLSKKFSATKSYGSYEALLGDSEIDAVYIGLPNGLHAEWAMRAAEAKKHVLSEKTLTLDVASAYDLSHAFRARGLRLMEGFMYRHHPQWSSVRAMLSEGAIGEVRSLRAWLSGMTPPEDHRFTALGGGALFDVTCYGVNVARFLLRGEPLSVIASSVERAPHVDESTEAVLSFDDGVLASVSGSLVALERQGVVVTGTRGELEIRRPFIPGWDETEVTLHRDGQRSTIRAGGANHFLHMVEHFSSLVLDAEQTSEPAEDGHANMLACAAIKESCRSGRRVELAPLS